MIGICKVVFVGESGDGKTSIISRIVNNFYDEKTESTDGATYASKSIEVQGQSIRLDLWDTGGQEKYRSLTRFFYKDSPIVIIVYDITKRESFEGIRDYW